jgi:hypothetical protein
MREFIKSLNKKQQMQFVELVKNSNRMLPAITDVIEEHLNGNSDGYEQIFGKDKAETSQKRFKAEVEVEQPASHVTEYTRKKMEAFEAESRAASVKINGYK